VRALDTFYDKAYRLMTSSAAKEAFDLEGEERYGSLRHDELGQCAWRDAGRGRLPVRQSRTATGTHRENTKSLRVSWCRRSTGRWRLVADLDERGLLGSTLVVLTTEFGRPAHQHDGGPRSWPQAFSIVLAGGESRAVVIRRRTDRRGGDRSTDHGTGHGRTVLHALGIDPATTVHTPVGRPVGGAGR
jgi:hypothetical protein